MLISRRSALQAIIHELLQSRDGVCYPRPGHPTSRYEERASLLISFSSISLQLSGRDGTGWNHRSYYKLRSLFEVFKAPTTLKTPHSDPLVDPFCAEYSSLNNAALKSDFVNLPELCSYARKCAEVCSPPRTSMPAAIRGFCRCHTSLSSRGFCGFIEFTLHNSTSSTEMIGREAAPGLVESKITFL